MRIEGWEDGYIEALERHAKLPFSWDESNCFLMAMDVVKAITGINPWEGQGSFPDEAAFRARLGELEFRDVGDALAAKFETIHPVHARRGDLGIVDLNGNEIAVVVTGMHAVGKSIAGTLRVPISKMKQAYKVG